VKTNRKKSIYLLIVVAFVALTKGCGSGKSSSISIDKATEKYMSTNYPQAWSFQFPLADYQVTGYRFDDKVNDKQQHAGEDAHGDPGTSVYAMADGDIKYASSTGDYGGVVVIEHYLPNGHYATSVYGHLRRSSLRGTGHVKKGEKIGALGDRGEIGGDWGPHLHFQIKRGKCISFGSSIAGWVPQGNIKDYHHPTGFIHIYNRLATMSHSLRGGEGVHWYGGYKGRAAIQDIKLPSSCHAAVVYDAAGGARKAYLIKCGFWNYWAGKGGPGSTLGMPITEEYGNSTEIFQDFKNAYLSYRIRGGAIGQHNYRRATPGKAAGGRWIDGRRISYAFAEAYERHGGRLGIGDASHPSDTADVHQWDNIWVQDFDYGKFGWCILMYNTHQDQVHLVRGGFWDVYKKYNLLKSLREPRGDEYRPHPEVPHQDFEGGYLEFDQGNLKMCTHDGRKIHQDSTYCNRSRRPICIPNQYICEDKNTQKQCYDDGRGWTKTNCPNGCFQNQCNFCPLGSSRCKDITTEQLCAPNGKSYVDRRCIHRCDNGHCLFRVPCIPNQKVCKDSGILLTCSSDGKRWTQTRCNNGCSNNQCNLCKPWTYRCKSITTEQVCSPDGKRFIEQICAHRCDNGRCLHQVPCTPNQMVCEEGNQFTCSADGKKWTKKSCEHGCGQWTCSSEPPPKDTTSPPLPKTLCTPHTRRCVNQKEALCQPVWDKVN